MNVPCNLLRLANEWIIAQVSEVPGDTLPGDPDCILTDPYVVDCDGGIDPWPIYSDDREVVVRSSDITTIVNPSKQLLARYIESLPSVE